MTKKTTETVQPLVLWQGKIEDTRSFLPADLEKAREASPLCPVCKKEGQIDLRSGRPLFAHQASHDAETPVREEVRLLIGRWLHSSLRGSRVQINLPWQDSFLDVGAVRADGARLAIKIISKEPKKGELEALQTGLLKEQTALLFLLDPTRLPERAWRARVFAAQFRRAESDLLRLGSPLIYILPHRRRFLLLEPPKEVLPLLTEKKNLGQCQAAAHHYRLSELRLKNGAWFVDRSFDEAPAPELSRRLLQRLENLR